MQKDKLKTKNSCAKPALMNLCAEHFNSQLHQFFSGLSEYVIYTLINERTLEPNMTTVSPG